MLTYLSNVWAGTTDPLWPHIILLSVSIIAAFTVGAGILFESSKYSAGVHKVATWLVLGGIAVEALCTVFLFVFDERISAAQQSKIIVLEKRIASRTFRIGEGHKISNRLSGFKNQSVTVRASPSTPESELFAMELTAVLREAGWKTDMLPGNAGATFIFPRGVVISYRTDLTKPVLITDKTEESRAAKALAESLSAIDIDATAVPGLMANAANTMEIVISEK